MAFSCTPAFALSFTHWFSSQSQGPPTFHHTLTPASAPHSSTFLFASLDLQTLRTVQAALGKGCLASSFICVYLFTGELYPTEIRWV